MFATALRAVRRHRGPSVWLLAFSTVVGAGSCADSVHLDPPSSSAAKSDGGAGDASTATPCSSNPDCAYPKPICDEVEGRCVECLTISDCAAKPGTVCSRGECVCGADASALSYCPADSTVGIQARCVDRRTSKTDCGSCGHACYGACVAGACADRWEPLPTVGAPDARSHHVAVWTGSRMFVWGGKTAAGLVSTGGLYDPASRTWTTTSRANAPSPRSNATAVWDPVEKVVIVWGGNGSNGALDSGGVYDPAKDLWKSTSASSAPTARTGHTAVWATGLSLGKVKQAMIVWGGTGRGALLSDGGIYDPVDNAWTSIPTDAALGPGARTDHVAVWDAMNGRMLVSHGSGATANFSDAFAYTPPQTAAFGAWVPVKYASAPTKRTGAEALWNPTAATLTLVGGSDVNTTVSDAGTTQETVYPTDTLTLGANGWSATAGGPPEGRTGHTAVWIDEAQQGIVFGGDRGSGDALDTAWELNDAGWTALTRGPVGRTHHTAVAAGTSLIVWGGETSATDAASFTNTGAVYNAGPQG